MDYTRDGKLLPEGQTQLRTWFCIDFEPYKIFLVGYFKIEKYKNKEYIIETICGQQNLKYLQYNSLQKKFAHLSIRLYLEMCTSQIKWWKKTYKWQVKSYLQNEIFNWIKVAYLEETISGNVKSFCIWRSFL